MDIQIGSIVSHAIHGEGRVINIMSEQLEVSFFGGVIHKVYKWDVSKKSRLF